MVRSGTVLGQLLWNIGYDWLLRSCLPNGMSVICYVDDTLVTAQERSYQEMARLAEAGTRLVVDGIKALGLRALMPKTETLLIHGLRRGPPRRATLHI